MIMARVFTLLSVLLVLVPGMAAADEVIGHTKIVSGRVAVLRDGVEILIKGGDELFRKDVLITGTDGSAGLTF